MNIVTFKDDDKSYLQWIEVHPQGYVLNVDRKFWDRSSTADPLSFDIHRANTGCVTRSRKGAVHWTKDYIKVCSLDLKDLEEESLLRCKRQAKKCKNCFGR